MIKDNVCRRNVNKISTNKVDTFIDVCRRCNCCSSRGEHLSEGRTFLNQSSTKSDVAISKQLFVVLKSLSFSFRRRVGTVNILHIQSDVAALTAGRRDRIKYLCLNTCGDTSNNLTVQLFSIQFNVSTQEVLLQQNGIDIQVITNLTRDDHRTFLEEVRTHALNLILHD